jgi:chromosome segregation ATPase
VISSLLRAFAFVRQLEATIREARDARIRAETQAAEYSSQIGQLREELKEANQKREQLLANMTDFLASRFLGQVIVGRDQIIEQPHSTVPTGPRFQTLSDLKQKRRASVMKDILDYAAGHSDDGQPDSE